MSYDVSTNLIKTFPYLFCNKNEINFLIDVDFNILMITEPSLGVWTNADDIKPEDIIGKNLYDEFFLQYNVYKEDLDLISHKLSGKDSFQYIGINFRRKERYRVLVFEYNKLVDGTLIHARGYVPKQPLNWYYLQSLQITRTAPAESDPALNLNIADANGLIAREQEVLFLMFHFHSYEEIACVINLFYEQKTTANAIGKLVRRSLYEKLNVVNLPSLKQKAYTLKYHLNVPKSLFPEILIEIP